MGRVPTVSANTTPMIQSCHSIKDSRVSSLPTSTLEQRIRYCRVHSGLSFEQLARKIGIHPDYCPLIERKADRISPVHLLRFCAATHFDPSFVLYGDNPPPVITLDGSTIGERLHAFRLSFGLSQRQLGYRLVGAKRNTSYGAWEKGQNEPELRSLMMIGNAFHINVLSFIPPL